MSVLLAAVTVLVAPAAAGAATVELQPVGYCSTLSDCRYMSYQAGYVLRYDGEAAERNRALVRRDGDALLIGDGGAILRPGRGCAPLDAHTARCDLASLPLVGHRLDGNDGDDAIAIAGGLGLTSARGQPRLLLGGAGADELVDGADSSALLGGLGADRLSGGEGDDRFFADASSAIAQGEDRDDRSPDVVDGGAGTDTVDYAARRGDLDVSLDGARPGGGEPGENDRLAGVEVLLGGRGDDRIAGGPGPDRVDGNGGADRLSGGDGDDELIGGPGADVLRGGRGDDRLGTGQGRVEGDRALCGPGRDVVAELARDEFLGDTWRGPDAPDVIGSDCEAVAFVAELDNDRLVRLDPRPARRGHTWTFANPCGPAPERACRGRVEFAVAGGRPFTRTSFRGLARVSVRLGPQQARRVARAGRVTVRVIVRDGRRREPQRQAAFTLSATAPR
ncbi:MAG: calcium-binding protein [Solirubrobacteraceae bacterium]|nr:calcium-binding protein [Solirubrobacteraceae bacterium]